MEVPGLVPPRVRAAAAARDARAFDERADLVLVIGPNGLLLHVGSGWARITGGAAAPPLGGPVVEALRSGSLDSGTSMSFEHAFIAAQRDPSSPPIPLAFVHPQKGLRRLEGRLYGPLEGTGNAVVVFHDVTDESARLEELTESERRFRMIAEATRDMVTETGQDGRFTYVSPACTVVLGYTADELLSRSPLHIHHDEGREVFREEIIEQGELGKPFSVRPHRLRRKDGSWIWVEATAVSYCRPDGEVRLIGVARDITSRLELESARQKLEEQLRASQRLESLGILAGGIAHDFNNYLTPIVGTASLLKVELPEDSPLLRRVEMIRKAAKRATDLTAQMLAYAGQTELRLKPLDVSQAIHEMEMLLEFTSNHGAELTYDLHPDLPPVNADASQIDQVVMNLVANAAEALGEEGGHIELRTGQIEADRALLHTCHLGDQREEGTYVYIEVRDDGEGMTPETREHVFDPFFSTKFTGRGLGLAVVLGIAKSHLGALSIDSNVGSGTCFRVLFPASSTPLDGASDQRIDGAGIDARLADLGSFLVVDDDEGARELTCLLLERAGYRVRSAAGGVEAIEIFGVHAADIACVVLDNTMPGVGGAEVFDTIRRIQPGIPIILASGYSRERVSDALLASAHTRFLQKPFDADQLVASIRELLAAR